jgi:NADPH:quinone reductase-like Zn-dependent oxidoreductase
LIREFARVRIDVGDFARMAVKIAKGPARGTSLTGVARAVRFNHYGGIDVLDVVDVDPPVPGPGRLLVRVRAAGINPGEAKIREGALDSLWPATFPSGQGSDLAGIVEQVGDGVEDFAVGDEVIGFTDNRASQAELVVVDAKNATRRPPGVSWEAAGALFVAGTTAYATVRAVSPKAGDTLVVAGAAGGVGSLAVQLGRLAGATVIGLASEGNHQWLIEHGVIPISYGDGVVGRIRAAAAKVDAFIDTFGGSYVEVALDLGVKPKRVDTIADFQAGEKYGVKTDGTGAAATAAVLAELADLIDQGKLEVPIAGVYPLDRVRDAFAELERGHTRGKIVLEP